VIVLQKDRLLLTRTVVLSAALILLACVASLSAPTRSPYPAGAGILSVGQGAGSSDYVHRYIGLQQPDLFSHWSTKQGSGPHPDIQLTLTATASEELHANSATYGELNRIVISSNGVDLDGNGQFDEGETTQDGSFDLWQLRVDGTYVTQLTNLAGDEIAPAYSPGGRLVAFSNNSSGIWQIYTVEVLTGTITQLTSTPGNKYHPSWSPDSNWMTFSSDAAGNRDIYVMRADGSQLPVQITTNPANDTQPAWSSVAMTATPIIFVREVGTGSRIFAISSTGINETQLSNGGGDAMAEDRDPAWRHNGTMVAFATNRLGGGGDTTRDFNIYSMSSAGELTIPATPRTKLDPNDPTSTDPADTYDERYPCFNPGLNPREPVRIFFTSDRPDVFGAEPDIWRLEVSDPVPPALMGLPRIENVANTEMSRYLPAGSDAIVSVEVYDRDSGVSSVVAEFKDPDSAGDDSQNIDHKQFGLFGSDFARQPITGVGALELDCDMVGQVALVDDGTGGDAVAGDGIFTGTWTTPASPSDFIIDIHVQDNAGNAFEYDDIYGLTTQLFAPHTNVLFVDDYCEGQGFIYAASWANQDYPTAYPVESYYTTNPGGAANAAHNTFRDGVSGSGRLGEDYDVWRIICRGPVTITDLVYYLPTKEVQLTIPDMTATREVLVADRAVVWAAPHTGDTWVAPGSLVSASTQATLSTFLDRGGRMMTSGQDIGFALTLNGTVQNNFYANYLHAQYVYDAARSECIIVDNGGHPMIVGDPSDPVAQHPFSVGGYRYHPIETRTGWWRHANVCKANDAALNTAWSDVINPIGGAVVTHTYDPAASPAGVAGIRYDQPGGYKTVYFSWGFEQTNREYYTTSPSNEWGDCKNHRSKIMHNVLCWLRTGGFQGRVLSISDGNQPINDPTPIVRVYRGRTLVAAVECEEDGRYVMGGLQPGIYYMEAWRPGFDADHVDIISTHGGLNYPVQDFAIIRGEPGAIRGTVTSAATGEPLATVLVCAYQTPEPIDTDGDGIPDPPDPDDLGPVISCTTTAADGTYMIGDVPPGDVIVVADGSGIGYGTAKMTGTVTAGNTLTIDLVLDAAPGVIVVTVTDDVANPLNNALVDVLDAGVVAATGWTNQAGEASITVAPGTYTVEAEAAGYQRSAGQALSVDAGQQAAITIALQSQPPGSLSGMITRAVSGEPVGGVTVELVVGSAIVATATSTVAITDPGGGLKPYNYRFDNAATGQVIVRPNPVGFSVSPSQRLETVATGAETDGVDFTLSSIRTFPTGLQLISMPYDYPLTDPATLLGVPQAQFQLAAYESNDDRYHLYPAAPADRFRLGHGYWMNLAQVRELSQEGAEATDIYSVALTTGRSGWNLVGCFFLQPVDFYALTVRDANGVVRTMQQAMAAGQIRSPLFAYVVGGYQTTAVMEPFVGYWLNVGADVSIIGDRSIVTLAAGNEPTRAAVIAPEDGWLMPLVASAAGIQDASTWVGCAASASDAYDVGVDVPKPPMPGSGPCVHAAVKHTDWGGANGAYAVDVRSSAARSPKWTVTVSAMGVEGNVALRWPDMSSVPANLRPVLRDPVTGRRVYMRTSQGYEFALREGSRDLEIELVSSEDALTVAGVTTSAVGGNVAISYTLTAAAAVDVRVMNMSGRLVQQVAAGTAQTAGLQQVVWNGRTKNGTTAPSGVYLVTVTARTDDGRTAQAVGPLQLKR
jgi:hypothetical protein